MQVFINSLAPQHTPHRAGFLCAEPLVLGKGVLFPLIKCPVFSVARRGSGALQSVSGREGALVPL